MQAQVIRGFKDRIRRMPDGVTPLLRRVGDIIDETQSRIDELILGGFVRIIITPSNGNKVVIVNDFESIMLHSTWGGSEKVEYYVKNDYENMGGDQSAYIYVPGLTTSPAQIAINF